MFGESTHFLRNRVDGKLTVTPTQRTLAEQDLKEVNYELRRAAHFLLPKELQNELRSTVIPKKDTTRFYQQLAQYFAFEIRENLMHETKHAAQSFREIGPIEYNVKRAIPTLITGMMLGTFEYFFPNFTGATWGDLAIGVPAAFALAKAIEMARYRFDPQEIEANRFAAQRVSLEKWNNLVQVSIPSLADKEIGETTTRDSF